MSDQNHPVESRACPRVNAVAIAKIENSQYEVSNWSPDGLCLSKFEQNVQVGDCLPIQFNLDFQEGIEISINGVIEVIWHSPSEQKLGAKFLNLAQAERNLLAQMSEEIQKGEITPAAATPEANPRSETLEAVETPSIMRRTNRPNYKKAAMYCLYVVIGTFLGGAALASVFYSAQHMQIKSATITDTVEPVVSTNNGNISAVLVEPGMKVQVDQPLLKINNQEAINREVANINRFIRDKKNKIADLTQEIELKRLELAKIPLVQRTNESLKQQEITKLQSYKMIAQSNLNSAHAKVQSLNIKEQLAQQELDRLSKLLEQGVVSQQQIETKTSELASIKADLALAHEAVQVAQTGVEAVKQGNFYDGNKLVGELFDLNVETIELQDEMLIAQNRIYTLEKTMLSQQRELQELKQQKFNLENPEFNSDFTDLNLPAKIYQAPFSGTVIQVAKSLGNTVNQGETLILLRPDSEELTVDAYLTHDQATLVDLDNEAEVKIASSGKHYPATVVQIDRTGGFKDAVQGKYLLDGSAEKPAQIQLVLNDIEPEAREELIGGTPVIVEFVKPSLLPRLSNIVRSNLASLTKYWEPSNDVKKADRPHN